MRAERRSINQTALPSGQKEDRRNLYNKMRRTGRPLETIIQAKAIYGAERESIRWFDITGRIHMFLSASGQYPTPRPSGPELKKKKKYNDPGHITNSRFHLFYSSPIYIANHRLSECWTVFCIFTRISTLTSLTTLFDRVLRIYDYRNHVAP